jgi:hypothetical protein
LASWGLGGGFGGGGSGGGGRSLFFRHGVGVIVDLWEFLPRSCN